MKKVKFREAAMFASKIKINIFEKNSNETGRNLTEFFLQQIILKILLRFDEFF